MSRESVPSFRVLDSVDPDAVRAAMAHAATSLFIVASKSGSTIEPNVDGRRSPPPCRSRPGTPTGASRFVAITDEGTALHRRATAERFRDIFVNPSDIGGRYSALSLFGMVPAALMGIDLDALLAGARAMEAACRVTARHGQSRPRAGRVHGRRGAAPARDKLTLLLPKRLESFGLWVEQLVAESTGKHGKGVVPIAGESGRDAPLGLGRASSSSSCTCARRDTPEPAVLEKANASMRADGHDSAAGRARARRRVPAMGGRDRHRRPADGRSIRSTSRT